MPSRTLQVDSCGTFVPTPRRQHDSVREACSLALFCRWWQIDKQLRINRGCTKGTFVNTGPRSTGIDSVVYRGLCSVCVYTTSLGPWQRALPAKTKRTTTYRLRFSSVLIVRTRRGQNKATTLQMGFDAITLTASLSLCPLAHSFYFFTI